jgi:hypothetical protein
MGEAIRDFIEPSHYGSPILPAYSSQVLQSHDQIHLFTMNFWFLFLSLMAEVILLSLILSPKLEIVFPSALSYAFKQLGDLVVSIDSVLGITTRLVNHDKNLA